MTYKEQLELYFAEYIAKHNQFPSQKECAAHIGTKSATSHIRKTIAQLKKAYKSQLDGLTQDEEEMLVRYRAIKRESEELGIDPEDVKHGWLKSDSASLFFNNPGFKDKQTREIDKLWEFLLERYSDMSPKYPKIKRNKKKSPHLLVVDPADIHIGKLSRAFETGEDYDQEIAVTRTLEGVNGILDKTGNYDIDKILLVIGNDVLHVDNPRRTTTNGTPQDTDGMWYENYLKGLQLYIDVIGILVQVADLHVVYNPSNHDYTSGFYLAQNIMTHFRNSKNITFDTSIAHRKYFAYHNNLIGTTHGDGAKNDSLALLMPHEAAENWVKCKHRYFYTHHVHHKVSKDVMSVNIETLRSPSATDSWHHKKGFQHAPKAIEGFIHHPEHGQIARLTHLF